LLGCGLAAFSTSRWRTTPRWLWLWIVSAGAPIASAAIAFAASSAGCVVVYITLWIGIGIAVIIVVVSITTAEGSSPGRASAMFADGGLSHIATARSKISIDLFDRWDAVISSSHEAGLAVVTGVTVVAVVAAAARRVIGAFLIIGFSCFSSASILASWSSVVFVVGHGGSSEELVR
jgi:hypothetical protein